MEIGRKQQPALAPSVNSDHSRTERAISRNLVRKSVVIVCMAAIPQEQGESYVA
jgi:hypothetical protein